MRHDPTSFVLEPNIPSIAIYDAAVAESGRKKVGPAFFMRKFRLPYNAARSVVEDLVRRGVLTAPDKFLMADVACSHCTNGIIRHLGRDNAEIIEWCPKCQRL